MRQHPPVSIRSTRRAQWHGLVAEQESGSLNQREFCVARGLTYSSFARWRRLVLQQRTSNVQEVDLPAFVSVEMAPPGASCGEVNVALSVTLPSGLRIDGIVPATVSTVAALIAAL